MSLLSWFGLKTPAPSAPQNTWSLTNTAFPASPRSPSRPLSRMGCGGDYRFQSRGRTAVGFYHPAGRPTASPAGYFYAQLSVCIVGLFWGVPACPRVGRQEVWGNVKKYGLASKGSIYQDCQGPADRVCCGGKFFGFVTQGGWVPHPPPSMAGSLVFS